MVSPVFRPTSVPGEVMPVRGLQSRTLMVRSWIPILDEPVAREGEVPGARRLHGLFRRGSVP